MEKTVLLLCTLLSIIYPSTKSFSLENPFLGNSGNINFDIVNSATQRRKRTFPLILPHVNRPQDQVHTSRPFQILEEIRGLEVCNTPYGQAGHCLPMEDCVIRSIHEDYIKHKGYFCILHQRAIGVCCPDDIKVPERYSEGMFASSSSLVSVTLPPINSTDSNSIVIVPDTDVNEVNGPLESLSDSTICGRNGKKISRIVGGTRSSVKDWPWMVAMLRRSDNVNFCGGAIISTTHILTAAHCVAHLSEKDIIVRLGDHDLTVPDETKPEDFNVAQIIRHEDYSNITYRHDIALLVLDKPMEYNTYMQPICLPPPGPRFSNITAVVTGWGTISFGGPSSAVLLEVPVPVWEQEQCVKAFAQIIYDTCMCAAAYEGGKDSCQGDSGGPLTMQNEDGRWSIIGVVSWGNGCARAGSPGVYTRVNDYLDWIVLNMQ
uniref:Peptidase S1 domain-containing protein n=1 Tax=Clastoptera arizonana TaxID=38151 RepID=A0A1B6DWJ8_9HEMI